MICEFKTASFHNGSLMEGCAGGGGGGVSSRAVTINRFESDRIDSSSQPINRFKTPESIH